MYKYVFIYLPAIVAANLSTAQFGPSVTILNALLFVGLNLTTRDKLHEAWHHKGLLWKMGTLIMVGSALSWFLNKDAGTIAIASFIAFGCAAIVDTIIYHILHKRAYLIKVNGSNIFSAAVDSILFPTIAFGGFLPWVTLGQFTAKVLGGAVWAFVLGKHNEYHNQEEDCSELWSDWANDKNP